MGKKKTPTTKADMDEIRAQLGLTKAQWDETPESFDERVEHYRLAEEIAADTRDFTTRRKEQVLPGDVRFFDIDTRSDIEKAFGPGFILSSNFDTTFERLEKVLGPGGKDYFRPDEPPVDIEPWECRIGAARLFVPPISISIDTQFKAGAIMGSALRQQNSPKFNSGHTETSIQMTLYFPNQESVLGYDTPVFDIDFDHDEAGKIDSFMSSLRGLIAQFKYAPFLPIKNDYLNRQGITGVVLQGMSISTIENFPFAMAVNLTLLKFNHKVYLPMISHFDQAIHWGRFRQYMGRAVNALNSQVKPFVDWDASEQVAQNAGDFRGSVIRSVRTAQDILDDSKQIGPGIVGHYLERDEFQYAGPADVNPSAFEMYFPFHSPARIDLPELDDLKNFDTNNQQKNQSWWQQILTAVGVEVNTYPEARFDKIKEMADETGWIQKAGNEANLVFAFFKNVNQQMETMGPAQLEEYVATRVKEVESTINGEALDEFKKRIRAAWFAVMYSMLQEDPYISRALALQDLKRHSMTIQEWEIPMIKLGLDPSKTIVHGVSVSMGNTIASMQLQMHDEPVHQHIGGQDARVDIMMTILGEDEIAKFRTMFQGINGLARLEHGHGVLGFLGIDNVITRMCGIRYAIPLEFNIETVEGYPHVYNVTLSLTDFDVFQQKRETLTSEQQAELIEAFGKRNPFLRLKQMWGMFNAYPDFPLSVRDDEGKIVGHFDPDFYFRSFKTIDDDLVARKAPLTAGDVRVYEQEMAAAEERYAKLKAGTYEFVKDEGVHVSFGSAGSKWGDWASITSHGVSLFSEKTPFLIDGQFDEPHAGNMVTRPYVDGLAPPSSYIEPYYGDAGSQYELMMRDMQYRDNVGRMVRAFPTFMLWLIDEGGNFAGVKMFDNFYGLQSVLDFSIVQSEDILGDTLILRVSNLYSRLSTKFRDYLDPDFYKTAKIINQQTTVMHRMLSGLSDYLVQLDTIDLKPGIRVHMRMGYGANPNRLDTVFNGVITAVETGEVITVTCQSDAIELSALVNSTNKNGHTGKIDGNMMGLYLSEPRDLMVTLLTQGSSIAKEVIAHASKGVVFSENRFGIKHFGTMLYKPLTEEEDLKQLKRKGKMKEQLDKYKAQATSQDAGSVISLQDMGYSDIISTLWTNLNAKQDYEIFKRNIYPGNGTGVAQFMGGDIGDLGLSDSMTSTGLNPDGTLRTDPVSGLVVTAADPLQIQADAILIQKSQGRYKRDALDDGSASYSKTQSGGILGTVIGGMIGGPIGAGAGVATGGTNKGHIFLDKLGIIAAADEDDGPFDEVSFRAQTHMKTVWDLFLVCAGLLPDYIVAVRPFEDRSTVFYGKPHWLYTSGVIPFTTGNSTPPPMVEPDAEWKSIYETIEKKLVANDNVVDFEDFYDRLSQVDTVERETTSVDPTATTGGVPWNPADGDVYSRPTSDEIAGDLPATEGIFVPEMHLPTSPDLETDINNHKQLKSLSPQMQHPFYMDRIGGGVGGADGEKGAHNTYDPSKPNRQQTKMKLDDKDEPGKNPGGLGKYFLTPEEEQWYCVMRWPNHDGKWFSRWKGARILIYSPATKKGVVCTPGDWGPGVMSRIGGFSPDVSYALGTPATACIVRVMPRNTALGPINFDGTEPVTATTPAVPTALARRLGEDPTASNLSEEDAARIPDWSNGQTNLAQYAFDYGWKVEGIPVDYSRTGTETVPGLVDEAGQKANLVYLDNRNKKDANKIWDDFRKYFATDKEVKSIFENSLHIKNAPVEFPADVKKEVMDRLIGEFQRFMWQNPYARGWLVVTADHQTDGTGFFEDILSGFAQGSRGASGDYIGTTVDPQQMQLAEGRDWDFGAAHSLFRVFIEQGKDAAVAHMRNPSAGKSATTLLGRGFEVVGRFFAEIGKDVKTLFSAVTTVASGLLNFMRLSLLQLSHGLSMASDMQRQTNMLNRVFNDSIYYAAGEPNSPQRFADNPFTREYGEPVAEIREPFQRIHAIGSFQHILNNGIIENSGVATVITAISNGSHPVTVHFDKGAPAEKQVERVVDTGLFWDHPKGWFGLKKLLNPIETSRMFAQKFGTAETGGDATTNEISSKRIALYHLKESLKDIYTGEIIVLGDASMRPHDLVYMGDVYERMYGFFEVEQVVHHFTPETGFITAITPNACVTINDPARFSLISYWKGRNDIQQMRNHLKEALKTNETIAMADYKDQDDLIASVADHVTVQLENSMQYTGGGSAVIKSMVSAASSGSFQNNLISAAPLLGIPGAGAVLGLGAHLAWKGWEWVRDNALDQHGCYIQYLTHNGQPMDGGLSYNQGVAVGQQFAVGMIFKGLKLGEIATTSNGQTQIRTQDVIKSLQWDEYGPNEAAAFVDMFVDLTNNEVRKISGRGTSGYSNTDGHKNEVYWVKVTNVVDGDTFDVSVEGRYLGSGIFVPASYTLGQNNRVRLAGAGVPEDPWKTDRAVAEMNFAHPGVRATKYTRDTLEGKYVALRIIPTDKTDQFGRALAYVFRQAPETLRNNEQLSKDFMMEAANGWPQVEWDSYMDDGTPYTYNWELITKGYGDVFTGDLERSLPGRGVRGSAW